MGDFIKVNDTLINMGRLLALQHRPEKREGNYYSAEHYLAVFDTGQQLRLTPAEGAAFVSQRQGLLTSPSSGMTATTSESAT